MACLRLFFVLFFSLFVSYFLISLTSVYSHILFTLSFLCGGANCFLRLVNILTSLHPSAYINITKWTHVWFTSVLFVFSLFYLFCGTCRFFLFVDLFRRSVNRVLPLPSRSLPLIPKGNVSGAEERSKQIQRQFLFQSFSPLWLHPFSPFLLPSNALITYLSLPALLFIGLFTVVVLLHLLWFVLHLFHSHCPFILSHFCFPR